MSAEPDHPAPAFRLPATGGQTLGPADYAGDILVLYFYPRDNTPGCIQEGEAFRDRYDDFRACGAHILGVSRDSLRRHEAFREKHGFMFHLASDADETACRSYDVLREKTLYGRRHIGIERSTFVIDPDSVIRHVWRAVKIAEHVDEVLAAVRALRA